MGNPRDDSPFGNWPYHGYESYQPLVIVPEPGPLALIALAFFALVRSRRENRRQ